MSGVTVLVHGIRTSAGWQTDLERLIHRADPSHVVIKYKYGHFDVIRFFVPFLRRRVRNHLRSFLRHLRTSPVIEGQPINIVAHSFGTALVATALAELGNDERPRIRLMLLSGCVLRSDFNWSKLIHRDRSIQLVVNDCGTRDAWPLIALAAVPGMGGAGRYGFEGALGGPAGLVNRFFAVDHSGFFDAALMRTRWLPLLAPDCELQAIKSEESPDKALVLYEMASEWVKVACYLTLPALLVVYLVAQKHMADLDRDIKEKEARRAELEERKQRRARLSEQLVGEGRTTFDELPARWSHHIATTYALAAHSVSGTPHTYSAVHEAVSRYRDVQPVSVEIDDCRKQFLLGGTWVACVGEGDGAQAAQLGDNGVAGPVFKLALRSAEVLLDVEVDGLALLYAEDTGRMVVRDWAKKRPDTTFKVASSAGPEGSAYPISNAWLLAGAQYVLVAYGVDKTLSDTKLYRASDGTEIAFSLPEVGDPDSGRWGTWGDLKVAVAAKAAAFSVVTAERAFVFDASSIKKGSAKPTVLALAPASIAADAAFTENGDVLAVVSSTAEDAIAQVWQRGPRANEYGIADQFSSRSLGFSADLAVVSAGTVVSRIGDIITIWDAHEGRPVGHVEVDDIVAMRCTASDGLPRCNVADRQGGMSYFHLDAHSALLEPAWHQTGNDAATVATRVDGRIVFATANRSSKLYVSASGDPPRTNEVHLPDAIVPRRFSGNGRLLLLNDGRRKGAAAIAAIHWDEVPPRVVLGKLNRGVTGAALSPNGRLVAWLYADRVEVTQTTLGTTQTFDAKEANHVAVSDGGLLALAWNRGKGLDRSSELRVVQLSDGSLKQRREYGRKTITALSLTSRGNVLLGQLQGIRELDVTTGAEKEIALTRFTPDFISTDGLDSRAVVAGISGYAHSANEIRIVDLRAGTELARASFKMGDVRQIMFEPDERIRIPQSGVLGLSMLSWRWHPDHLITHACERLNGTVPDTWFKSMVAELPETQPPCAGPVLKK